jgi:hypothetical protein
MGQRLESTREASPSVGKNMQPVAPTVRQLPVPFALDDGWIGVFGGSWRAGMYRCNGPSGGACFTRAA